MKNQIEELMIKRKRNTLHDYQTLVLIDGIRQNLSKEMVVEVDQRLQKASDTLADQGNTSNYNRFQGKEHNL